MWMQGLHILDLYSQMFPSIQVQITGPLPSLYRSNVPRSQESSQSSSSVENINPDINLDFEENSPFQEAVIPETFQRLDKSFFQDPKELNYPINTGNLIQMFLPK